VGRDRARLFVVRLSIPPVVTVRAAFIAHGDRLVGLFSSSSTKFRLRFTDIHRGSSVLAFGYFAPKRLQAVALRHVRGFPALRLLWLR